MGPVARRVPRWRAQRIGMTTAVRQQPGNGGAVYRAAVSLLTPYQASGRDATKPGRRKSRVLKVAICGGPLATA